MSKMDKTHVQPIPGILGVTFARRCVLKITQHELEERSRLVDSGSAVWVSGLVRGQDNIVVFDGGANHEVKIEKFRGW